MNNILLLGIAIFFGVFGGKIFRRFKIPQVVGYVTVGLFLGKSVFNIFTQHSVDAFDPVVNFTLGVIGFVIGSELKGEVFKKYGRSIYFILVSEGMLAFLSVFAAVTLITKEVYLGLLLGAIASATDPASTVSVLWEYKTRGPLTTTLTSIVALDDGLALILYGLVSVFSKAMITKEHFSLVASIGGPLLEILECFILGLVVGVILIRAILHTKEKDLAVSFAIGSVAAVVGLAIYFRLDLILSSMVLGAVVANVIPRVSQGMFDAAREMTAPLYILFFVIVGASLDIHTFVKVSVIAIILGYLVARSLGKIFGATFGAIISKAKKTVVKYTGICLFTQGGVAVGLAMSIAHNLSYAGPEGKYVGNVIITVVAATTFVVQLIGPILVKLGATKADEVGRNVTEEDIMKTYKVKDIMRKDFSAIREDTTLAKIIETIKERESFHFPVVDKKGDIVGIISLGNLRSVLAEEQLNQIVLAEDVASPVEKVIYKDQPLDEALKAFNKGEVDYLPVVDDKESKKIVGVVEYHPLAEFINRKLFERQHSLESA